MSEYLDSGAQLSPCERYRYTLWRKWDETLPKVAFIGLNPSTADATLDDPTIRRCRGFAMSHGYGGFTMLNLWAFRATDPKNLPVIVTPEEEENLATLARVTREHPRTVAAWGAHPKASIGAARVLPHLPELHCLHMTGTGAPGHPLYLPNTCQMNPWLMQRAFALGSARSGKDEE